MIQFILTQTPLFYLVQPFWRDEAFSVFYAEKPIGWIISHSSYDPPLYYILLHVWMKIFGQGEVAVRSLSLVGFALAVIVAIQLSEYLFKKHWLSWFVPLLLLVNPMLHQYACEARAYGLYMFFAVFSVFGYIKKDWRLFITGSILGFYTHSYMALVPFSCFVHYLTISHGKLKTFHALVKDVMVRSIFWTGICMIPWIVRSILSIKKFASSWYFPVDFHLVKSVLGNMYTGYEGTPWYLWNMTTILSLCFLFLAGIALVNRKTRKPFSFFFFMTIFPLTLVITISFAKPLFVNRYLIFVTLMELFCMGFAVFAIQKRYLQYLCAIVIFIFSVWFSFWFPSRHAKQDFRTPMTEINNLVTSSDVIYADNPLHFFETLYYAKDRKRVYLYLPSGGVFPWYVGDVVVEPHRITPELPLYPTRAFIIHNDATYTVMYRMPFGK
jgi:uncharacterized membrane protein